MPATKLLLQLLPNKKWLANHTNKNSGMIYLEICRLMNLPRGRAGYGLVITNDFNSVD